MNDTPRVAAEFVFANHEYRLIYDGIKYQLQSALHSKDATTKVWEECNANRVVFLLSRRLEELSQ